MWQHDFSTLIIYSIKTKLCCLAGYHDGSVVWCLRWWFWWPNFPGFTSGTLCIWPLRGCCWFGWSGGATVLRRAFFYSIFFYIFHIWFAQDWIWCRCFPSHQLIGKLFELPLVKIFMRKLQRTPNKKWMGCGIYSDLYELAWIPIMLRASESLGLVRIY